jgi:site-specific recombinase XerD
MASVITVPKSPYWIARMRLWIVSPEYPAGGFWRLTMRSTRLPHKTTHKRAAKAVADEMERTGREARNPEAIDEHWAQRRLESLLRLANVPNPRKKTSWHKAVEGWLAAKSSKPRSLEKYRNDVAHFTRWLGVRAGHDLRGITADDIAEFRQSLADSGLAESTAVYIVKAVRSVLRRAVLLRQLDTNVAELVSLHRTGGTSRKAFTKDEITAILAAAEPEWRTACLFGLLYGMRIGDATRRSHEEIKDGVLHFVPEKKSRKGVVVSVPLMGELTGLSGKGPITPSLAKLSASVASRQFSALLDRAGIDRQKTKRKGVGRGITDKTFHSWRHTTNSLLVDAGVDQRVRQLICDHDSTKVSNNYTHASIETMAKALTPLASIASSQTPADPHTSAP